MWLQGCVRLVGLRCGVWLVRRPQPALSRLISFGMRKGCAPMGGARACGSLTFIHNPSKETPHRRRSRTWARADACASNEYSEM